jgi:hypothetical protein
MDPEAAPGASSTKARELVLGCVLRPQQVGVHLPGRGHDRRGRTAVASLVHESGALLAELRQLAGRSQERRKVAAVTHRGGVSHPDTPGLRARGCSVGTTTDTEQPLAQAGERRLHRLVGREEDRDLAAGQLRSELGTRLTQEFAVNNGDYRKDRRR